MELPLVKCECACTQCQDACVRTPGWFAPGEVSQAAALLGMEVPAFFQQYLAVDFWLGERGEIEIPVLAPANSNNPPGQEYRFDQRGQCVFYQEGRCAIHAAKPLECAVYHHDKTQQEVEAFKQMLIQKWEESPEEVEALLGRPPVAPQPGPADFADVCWLLDAD